jgi:hypothetical protein
MTATAATADNHDLRAYISDDMRADWESNRDELLAFWASNESIGLWFRIVPPWLNVPCDREGTLPWGATHLDADPESTRAELRVLARRRTAKARASDRLTKNAPSDEAQREDGV